MDVLAMPFGKIYDLLVQKVVRKGGDGADVDRATLWLTGYAKEALDEAKASPVSYGDFFRQAPEPNPLRLEIVGKVCGVSVADIEDGLGRDVRTLDLIVDRLAKGRRLDAILPH